jgi:hypothetical protein
MSPMSGPKLSSRMTRMRWSTSTSTVGRRSGPGVDRAHRRRARARPWRRVADLALEQRHLRLAARQRADVGRVVERVADAEAAHRRDEGVEEGLPDAAVHVDRARRRSSSARCCRRRRPRRRPTAAGSTSSQT